MRGAHEAFSHPPEDFRKKEAFELKRSEKENEKQRRPAVKLRLIKTETPQEHANAIDQAQKRAEALADKSEQSKEEVIVAPSSSVDLKSRLDQISRWQVWRRAERTVLQNQLDQALHREKDARDARKERLKMVHASLEQTIDGPSPSRDPKQQRVETLLQQRASAPEGV